MKVDRRTVLTSGAAAALAALALTLQRQDPESFWMVTSTEQSWKLGDSVMLAPELFPAVLDPSKRSFAPGRPAFGEYTLIGIEESNAKFLYSFAGPVS